jgi:hypothetical protein
MIGGCRPVYAKKMVRIFGEKGFDIIEAEPDRLREVECIGPVLAHRITDAWAEQQFTGIWNEFLFGVIFTSGQQQPITAALVALGSGGLSVHAYNVSSAAVLIGAFPPLLVYFLGGKYFVRGLTQGAIK